MPRASDGPSPGSGTTGAGRCGARRRPGRRHRRRARRPARTHDDEGAVTAGLEEPAERAGRAASSARGPWWTTRPWSSTATWSARAVVRGGARSGCRCGGEQSVGGANDPRLGERVHPRGGLVEDDDARPRGRAAARRRRAAPPPPTASCRPGRAGCRRRRAGRRPNRSGRARRTAASTRARGRSANSAMFSASVPARISVRWVTTPTAARSRCRSRSRTSTPPRNTEPAVGSTARDTQRRERGLAGPGAPDEGAGRARPAPAGRRRAARSRPRGRRSGGRELEVERPRRAPAAPPAGSGSRRAAAAAGSPHPCPACSSGRWRAIWSTWPTKVLVTRNSVTSWATDSRRRRPARPRDHARPASRP